MVITRTMKATPYKKYSLLFLWHCPFFKFVNCICTVLYCIFIVNNKVKFNNISLFFLLQEISLGGIYWDLYFIPFCSVKNHKLIRSMYRNEYEQNHKHSRSIERTASGLHKTTNASVVWLGSWRRKSQTCPSLIREAVLGVNKTTNCSVVYCGAHLETTKPSRMYCGKKAQAVPLHVTLSHLHSVVYLGKAWGI